MRAAILRWYGAPPDVGDFDEPQATDGQEVVEIVAGGLNPVDIRMASGHFYGGTPPLPSVAGREGIGRRADGSLVYFDQPVSPCGSFAERAPIVSESAIPLGADIDPALAVAFGIAGLAAGLPPRGRPPLPGGGEGGGPRAGGGGGPPPRPAGPPPRA